MDKQSLRLPEEERALGEWWDNLDFEPKVKIARKTKPSSIWLYSPLYTNYRYITQKRTRDKLRPCVEEAMKASPT